MNKKEYLTNFKLMFFMLLGSILLILLFLSTNIVHALEITDWGLDQTNYINSLTSTSSYTYDAYNSDTIKEFIFNRSNEQFFDNTYTQSEFYKNYNYVILGYSETTIRVFVQNYNLAMNYQGLNAIEGNDTRFFFANITLQWRAGSTTFYDCGVAVIYSYYIDINYNTMSYTFSDNNPLTDLEFYRLGTGRRYIDSGSYFGSIDINMKLFDSYNGNFSWIEFWNSSQVNDTTYHYIANYTDTYTTYGYYNSIVEFPELEYMSSGTPDDETGSGGESTTPDYTDFFEQFRDFLESIDNNTNESKGFLEGIGETLSGIGQSIGDGLNDLINGISDTLDGISDFLTDILDDILNGIQSIFDWLTGNYNLNPIENFFNNFNENDYGLQVFITGPIDIIRDLDGGLCQPLRIPLPLLNENNSIYLPCMSEFYQEQIPDFLNWWHILSNALVIFFVGRGTYNAIHDLLDPKARDSVMRGML